LNLREGNGQTERPAKNQVALLQERRAARDAAVEVQRTSGLRAHLVISYLLSSVSCLLSPAFFLLPSFSYLLSPIF
jgi:hypothetical protein